MIPVELKIAAIGALVLGVAVAAVKLPDHFESRGYDKGVKYMEDQNAKSNTKAELERAQTIMSDLRTNERKLREALTSYENEIARINVKYKTDLDKLRADGGLRFKPTAAVCPTETAGGKTEAKAASEIDGKGAQRLPAGVEERLFRLAKRADEIQAKLTELQDWIENNGLYP